MRHYYVKVHQFGRAVSANTGKELCLILRFKSKSDAREYVENYSHPSNSPSAFAELVTSKEARPFFPRVNVWGDELDHWLPSECGKFEYV